MVLAAFMAVSTVASAQAISKEAVASQLKEIDSAQAEIQSLQEQLSSLKTKRNVEIFVAWGAAAGTIVGAVFSMVGASIYGYERSISLQEKAILGSFVATPAAIAIGSGYCAHLNSNKIDEVLQKLDIANKRLQTSKDALKVMAQD